MQEQALRHDTGSIARLLLWSSSRMSQQPSWDTDGLAGPIEIWLSILSFLQATFDARPSQNHTSIDLVKAVNR